VLRNVKAPKGFRWAERFARVRSVVQLEALDAGHTRLTASCVGFEAQDGELYDFFRAGNAEELEAIRTSLRRGAPAGPAAAN
jgi:hypothetical protein